MANDNWQGRSHGEIVNLLSALKSDAAHEESQRWDNTSTAVADSIDTAMAARTKLLDNTIWDGEAAGAAYDSVDKFYKEAANPQTGLAAEAGKISQAALQDGETLIAASRVAQNYPEPGPGAPTNRKKEELEAIRAEAQRMYTDPLSAVNRPEITDGNSQQQQLGQIPQGGGGGNSGGSSGSGGGTQTPPASSDGSASKDTKPQLAGGEGQQAGAGQGQGSGGGQGGGQGAGSGGGQGAGSGGSGSGLGSGSGGSGLPIGSTTAAGFSPSSAPGTGAGGPGAGTSGPGGLSALRGGAGLPGGAAAGAGAGAGGVNPASVGAAGVRGMGPMGMMGGGAHGGHGKGDDDDDHEIPSYLINVDNGNELFGTEIKASPGVIGDWTENEEAEKKAREAEIRRYKSLGWNVKFE